MLRYLLYLTVGLIAFGLGVYFACSFCWKADEIIVVTQVPNIAPAKISISAQTNNAPKQALSESSSIDLEMIFTDQQNADYKGFNISIETRKRDFERNPKVDVDYVIIKKNNRRIFESDKVLDELEMSLRDIRFGFFPFLGDENNKQLLIESSGHRYTRYTIINLSPKFEILFDSSDYSLMNQLKIIDFNEDGKYEIAQDLSTFFYFYVNSYRMGFASTSIAFKYDLKKRKYIFANHSLSDYLIKDSAIESSLEKKTAKIKEIKSNNSDPNAPQQSLFTAVMDVFLTYLYIGKEKEAWASFEEYDLPDKEAVKAELKKFLNEDGLYEISQKTR